MRIVLDIPSDLLFSQIVEIQNLIKPWSEKPFTITVLPDEDYGLLTFNVPLTSHVNIIGEVQKVPHYKSLERKKRGWVE